MKNTKIAILGGGNLGTSLAKGLLDSGQFTNQQISSLPKKGNPGLNYLQSQGFQVTDNNQEAVSKSGIIVTSVKPQQFSSLAEEIKDTLTPEHILISTVTGITLRKLKAFWANSPCSELCPILPSKFVNP